MKTGIILDDIFLEHDPGPFHPERCERLVSIQSGLATYANHEKLRRLTSRAATKDELLLVHSSSHIQKVSLTSGRSSTQLDPDTSTSARSYEAALSAAGSLPVLIDALFQGQIQNGFAFVRPPGHHAEPDCAMGFCLFNNIAVGAAYALEKHGLKRVLVLDFDVHHGNGTQRAFYDRSDVLFISTHQYPLYPGTGDLSELGESAGLGYTLNFPLPAGTGDPTYNSIFRQIIHPVSKAFAPQLVLVSAGYDAYASDPLAGMAMTPEGFAGLTQTIVRLAHETCGGKLAFILEGGYHLDGLRTSILRTLDLLSGQDQRVMEWPPTPQFEVVLSQTRKAFGHFWKF